MLYMIRVLALSSKSDFLSMLSPLFIILLKKGKVKPCRTLFHFSLLLITSKAPKANEVKSEEVKSKAPKTDAFGALVGAGGFEPPKS